jgi:hypothetical protein
MPNQLISNTQAKHKIETWGEKEGGEYDSSKD